MLGRSAGQIFWMARYLERAENMARLIDAGFRLALTGPQDAASDEWNSVLTTIGAKSLYLDHYEQIEAGSAIDFLLRSPNNPSSILSCFNAARANGRMARTALSREMWEYLNEGWMRIQTLLQRSVATRDVPNTLSAILQQCALVRGAAQGTLLRTDNFDFTRLGTFIERGDSTARLLDVKYYLLLPSIKLVGGSTDYKQWQTLLRSVSGERAFHWINTGNFTASSVAEFLILDRRMPRSLHFCSRELVDSLDYLRSNYQMTCPSYELGYDLRTLVEAPNIQQIFQIGLHEFIGKFLTANAALSHQIEIDYRFYD